MALFKSRFQTDRQDWTTPDSLFEEINKEFQFSLDAAADEQNKKCNLFFSESENGLLQDWGNHIVWVNPPYGDKKSKLVDWVRKAHLESQKGSTVVMLIPARTNTNWFHDICLKHGEVRFIRGRPRFGGASHGLPQPLCFVIFRKKL